MRDIGKYIQGLIYFWSWNCSIFGGYLLFVPLTVFQFFTPRFYRKTVDLVVTYWQYYVTTLLIRQNCIVCVSGDTINSDEVSIVISNHRTRVDWNFLWPVMYHAVEGKDRWWHSTKFVLKNSIKNIPGAGWVMRIAMYIFINRNWNEDKSRLDSYIKYVKDMSYTHTLILFPEGTDLTPRTKESSDKFAINNGLPKYKHVLHPRSTGFVYLVNQMRKKKCLDAVYDLTLIYPDECPQNEEELFFLGKFPKRVLAHLVRYPVPSLPDSEEELKTFLEKLWLEKERTIEEFRKTGRFLQHGKELNNSKYLTLRWAYFTHCLWMIGTALLVFLVYVSRVYFYIVIGHILALYIVPVDVDWHKLRRVISRLVICREPIPRGI